VFPLLLAVAVGGAAWVLGAGVPSDRVLGVESLSSIVAVALQPSIPALPQRRLTVRRAGTADGLEVLVHGWRPDGEATACPRISRSRWHDGASAWWRAA